MKIIIIIAVFFLSICIASCTKIKDGDETYGAHDVWVGINKGYAINEVFDFINQFNHEVEYLRYSKFISELPQDSIQYVKDYLSTKDYLTKEVNNVFVTYLVDSNQLYISTTMSDIHKKKHQEDWLNCMDDLELIDDIRPTTEIHTYMMFQVPWHREKFWVEKFLEFEIVRYAELNHYNVIEYE